MDKLNQKAEKFLNMMVLDGSDGDWDLLRDCVDRWFCYTNGYVTNTGTASWGKIVGNEFVTDDFVTLKESGVKLDQSNHCQKDHIVPLAVLINMLNSLPNTKESLLEVMNQFLKYATITKEEDKKLNDCGLKSKMPAGFYDPKSPLYMDPFARYKVAGITLSYAN